jgi:hypothetical protein
MVDWLAADGLIPVRARLAQDGALMARTSVTYEHANSHVSYNNLPQTIRDEPPQRPQPGPWQSNCDTSSAIIVGWRRRIVFH